MIDKAITTFNQIDTSTALLEYVDHIVFVRVKQDADIDVEQLEEQFRARQTLVKNDKYGILVDARNLNNTSNEAREFMANHTQPKCVGMAVLTTNLSTALAANFYLKFHKPKLSTKIFKKEENALKWLKSQLKKINSLK